MSIFDRLQPASWHLETAGTVWAGRTSLYEHLRAHASPGDDGSSLPDEDRLCKEGELRWAAGALDGCLGHPWPSKTAK